MTAKTGWFAQCAAVICFALLVASLVVALRLAARHAAPDPFAILPVTATADEILGPNALFDERFYQEPNLLVVYTDFNCAACRALFHSPRQPSPRLPHLSVVTIPYPLSGTAEPGSPCVAAVAADMQGRFTDMAAALYSYVGPEAGEDTVKMAARLYLDVPRFKRDCAGKALSVVLQNIAQGRRLGVHATPTLFFIMPTGKIVQPATIRALERYPVAEPEGLY